MTTLKTLRDALEDALAQASRLEVAQPDGRTKDLVDAIRCDLSMRLDDLDQEIAVLAKWGEQ